MRAAARITLLTALAGVGFMATPAQAQQVWGWGYYGGFGHRPPIVDRPARYYLERPMPAGEIMEILRDEGYRPLGRPVLSGDAYVAQAENNRGQRLQVIVHAYDGDILERRLIGRGAPERSTVRRPAAREEAALPPKSVTPLTPRDGEAVAPPLPVERAPLAKPVTPDDQAAAPLSPPPELNQTPPRGSQTVTPPKPATPPAAARPRPPNQASAPPKVQQPANPALSPNPGGPAPTLESTEPPKEQQARQQPRVILPNPADSSSNSSLPPVTPLETQPATPVPPTPPVAPAPLN